MRLIDADALVENIESEIDKENKVPLDDDRKYFYCAGMRNVIRFVKRMPTIDAVKHGRWVERSVLGTAICSICGYCADSVYADRYCRHCGAKMDGKEE